MPRRVKWISPTEFARQDHSTDLEMSMIKGAWTIRISFTNHNDQMCTYADSGTSPLLLLEDVGYVLAREVRWYE